MNNNPATRGKTNEATVVAVLFLTWGSVFLARTSALYLAPFLVPDFHLTPPQVGLLGSVLAMAWAVSGLIFGALSDRIGRRVILVPCAFAFAILCGLSGLAHSFNQLLVLRVLLGIAEGPAWPILTAIVKDASPVAHRGRNVGIVVSAAALVGLAIAPILATQVAIRYGWRWSFVAASIPGLIASVLVWRFVHDPVSDSGSRPVRVSGRLSQYLSIFKFRNIWLCFVGTSGFMCWLFVVHTFAPLYLTQVAHQPATTAGFLIGATGFGSFVLGFLLPGLSDKIGRKQGLLLMAGLSIAVPIFILIPSLYRHLWLLAALLFVTNASQGVSAVVMVLIPSETVPIEFAATAIGLTAFVGEIIGGTIAPIVGGRLAQHYGLEITMWMAAAGMLVVLLVGLLVNENELVEGRAVGMH